MKVILMNHSNVKQECARLNNYLKTLEKAFIKDSVLFIARVCFGLSTTIKIDALWELSSKESPIMYIVYIVVNKETPREILDKNLEAFRFYFLKDIKLPFIVFIIPFSFFKEN
mgnify:CR=1 FL=1